MEIKLTKAISNLEPLREEHSIAGKRLFVKCNSELFPCDALYLSVLNRSLELFDGFLLLVKNNNYGCCMALLRLQLDNVLRFYGVLNTPDPHKAADEIYSGKKLSSIKDKHGRKLKDCYLVKCIAKNNSWVEHVYKLTSGYIHLSDQHIFHMLGKSIPLDNDIRELYIGSGCEHIDHKHIEELIKAFGVITDGIFKLLPEWESISKKYDVDTLKEKYIPAS